MKKLLILSATLLLAVSPHIAKAAFYTWDPQGTTGANPYLGDLTGTWENAKWSTVQTGQSPTVNWVEGSDAVFAVHTGLGTPDFTVTMNSDHTVAGIFDGPQTPNSCHVTINGNGKITFASGLHGVKLITAGDGSTAFVTINNEITGAGGIAVEGGTGQLFLNGVNTYSGGTQLGFTAQAWTGIINFNNSASFGTGKIVMTTDGSGGALVVEGSSAITIPNNFTPATANLNIVGNPAGVTFSGTWVLGANTPSIGTGGNVNNLVILSGVISGTGGFGKQSTSPSGTLKLTGVNTYSGATTIPSGILAIGGSGKLGNGSYAGTIANAGKFIYNSSAAQTLSGVISGAGTLEQQGSGTLTLSGVNTYTGTTTVSAGTLKIGGSGKLANASVIINNGTFIYNSSAAQTLSGVISGSGNLTEMGTGTLTLTGVNTMSGTINIVGSGTLAGSIGRINFNNSSAAGTAQIYVTGPGAEITCNSGASTTANTIHLDNPAPTSTSDPNQVQIEATSGDSWTITGKITGTGGLIRDDDGAGTLTLSGANDFSGGFYITSRSLNLGSKNALGTGTFTIGDPITAPANAISFNIPSTLTGANAVANPITINQPFTVNASQSAIEFSGPVTLAASKMITVSSGNNVTLSGNISGGFSLTKAGTGAGQLVLGGNNTYSGGTAVSAGTLTAQSENSLGSGDVTVESGATLKLSNASAMTSTADLILNSGTPSVNLNFVGTQTVATLTIAGVAKAAGTWGAVGSGATHESGLFTGSGLLNVATGPAQTITFGAVADKVYGDAFNPGATASSGLTVSYSVVSASASVSGSTVTVTDLGSVTIRASQAGNDNYNPASDVDQTFNVTAAPLSIIADDFSRSYGADNPAFTVHYSGFKLGETNDNTSDLVGSPVLSTAADTNSAPGAYVITNATDAVTSSHYALTFADGTLTVTQAVLTVTADSFTRIYGETNPVLTTSYSGFVNSETTNTSDVTGANVLTLTSGVDTNSAIGVYVITNATGTLASANYSFSLANGMLTITNAFSTNVVVASENPVTNSSVTLMATVSALAPSPAIPQGSVQFKTNDAAFGAPVALVDGVAATNVSSLVHGTYTIAAEYVGNTNLIGSTNSLSPDLVINNRAPVAGTNTITRNNGTNGTKVAITELLALGTDVDGDSLSLSDFSATSVQGATISSNGAFLVYSTTSPIDANDSFTYTISDGQGGTAIGTVTVTTTGANLQSRTITLVAATNSFDGSFFGVLNTAYTVQYSTNLIDWDTLTNVITSTNGIGLFSDPGPFSPERYYRIVYP